MKRYEGWRLDRERKQGSREKRQAKAIIDRQKNNIDKLQTGLNHIIEKRDNKIKKLTAELNEREVMFTEKESECFRLKEILEIVYEQEKNNGD